MILVILLVATLGPTLARADGPKSTKIVTYTATQDATVSSAAPDSNFGEDPRLSVRSHDPTLRTYIRFDLRRAIDLLVSWARS